MSHRNRGKFTVLNCACVIALALGMQLFTAGNSRAQDGEARPPAKGKISKVPAQPLDWPLPPNVDKSYDAIDGHHLHAYVEETGVHSRAYWRSRRSAGRPRSAREATFPSPHLTWNIRG